MNRSSLGLVVCVSILFALGLLMIFNTTSAEVLDRGLQRSTHHALIKQLVYAVFGALVAFGIWFVGYQHLIRLSPALLIGSVVLLLCVFLPGIGQQINGAYRWINLLGNSLQPSEFVKFVIPLYFIASIAGKKEPLPLKSFIQVLIKIAIPMGLILIEPDNGTVVIIFASLIVLCILSSQKWIYWGLPLLILIFLGALVASQMPHVSDRIKVYLNPEYDLKGKGHQPYQAKIAAGSGGLWGKGWGESMQKLEYLPEARNDYIAAIFAEETGFVGIIGIVLLYMGVGFCGFSIAQAAKDQEGFYTAAIITFLLCFQAFLNLGVVSGLLPSKGTNLPFFSQGGSSLIVNIMALCILLNIAHAGKKEYEVRS